MQFGIHIHVDGHNKLIRWRFVTHEGVDGYSRTIVYLRCSDNNCASTVLDSFAEAVRTHGLPCRVRSDLGGENVEVWRYIIEQHSDNSAVITGSSTHNDIIERLWRDVFRSVGSLFYDTFRMLESEEKLDCLNEVDLFCLHYMYEPRINFAFVQSWNNHSISTARSLTPNLLFVQGAMERNRFPHYPNPVLPQQALQSPHSTSAVQVVSSILALAYSNSCIEVLIHYSIPLTSDVLCTLMWMNEWYFYVTPYCAYRGIRPK